MNHPEELLAPFIDGTATLQERAEVESHLTFCQTCREEIELARSALAALSAVPELEPPSLDLSFFATHMLPASAGSRSGTARAAAGDRGRFVEAPDGDLSPSPRAVPHRPSLPSRSTAGRRWPIRAAQALVAVAAVSLAVVFFANLSHRSTQTASAPQPPAGTRAAAVGSQASPGPGRQEQAYTRRSLDALALDLAMEAKRKAPESASSPLTPADPAEASPGLTSQAVACIQQGTSSVAGTYLFYVQRATYQGIDAYIGAFVQRTGNDRVMLVAAVSVEGCRPLRFIRQAI